MKGLGRFIQIQIGQQPADSALKLDRCQNRVAGEESAEGGGVIAGAEKNQVVRLGEPAFAREAVGIVGCPPNPPHIAEPVIHIGYHTLPEGIRQLPHRPQPVIIIKCIQPAQFIRIRSSITICCLNDICIVCFHILKKFSFISSVPFYGFVIL